MGQAAEVRSRNEVVLIGRLAAEAVEKQLPSGDVLTTFRVIVERAPRRSAPEGVKQATVDAIECVAWTAAARRAAGGWAADDVVEVHGALHRRFWRAGAGAQSICEVEVTSAKRLRKAA
jgi:single-strand DNA-binding protein